MAEPNLLPKEKRLGGRVALVTGAGKRLGRAIALRLAEEGAGVALHYRKSEKETRELVSEIKNAGGRAEAFPGELASVQDIRRMVHEAGHEMGRLDILINSAANFLPSTMISTTEEVWDAALDTNLKAPFFVAQAAAQMLKRSRGVIVNFADTGGLLGWPGYMAHSIAKAGVVMLTRVLAKAMAPEVRVNAIAPGTITMPGDPPEWETEFVKLAPLKHSGTTEDVVSAVSYLVHAEFVTGQVLVVDGGRVL
jgi:NAD(P)-dependent dehydrogenase (short-subunit alcohol dehydrogenase family)